MIGYFKCEIEAALAYDVAARALGEWGSDWMKMDACMLLFFQFKSIYLFLDCFTLYVLNNHVYFIGAFSLSLSLLSLHRSLSCLSLLRVVRSAYQFSLWPEVKTSMQDRAPLDRTTLSEAVGDQLCEKAVESKENCCTT
jgi:hypothetical protein